MRKKNKELFMNDFGISEELYDRNEAIFFCLIHSTKKESDLSEMGIAPMSFITLASDVCGLKPN